MPGLPKAVRLPRNFANGLLRRGFDKRAAAPSYPPRASIIVPAGQRMVPRGDVMAADIPLTFRPAAAGNGSMLKSEQVGSQLPVAVFGGP